MSLLLLALRLCFVTRSQIFTKQFLCYESRFGSGQWTPEKRPLYNLDDALTRHTTQVKTWIKRKKVRKIRFLDVLFLGINAGLPRVLDSNLGVFGQSRNVEYEIGDMGKTIFGTTVLSQSMESGAESFQ